MTMSEEQTITLMKPLHKRLPPSLNVLHYLPLEYRYSMTKYIGLGLLNLYVEHVIEQLNYYLMHITASTLPGKHMHYLPEQLKLEVGTREHYMHKPYHEYGKYITPCLMSSIWKHTSNIPIMIKHRQPVVVTL